MNHSYEFFDLLVFFLYLGIFLLVRDVTELKRRLDKLESATKDSEKP